jgi:hypothetical protein
MIYIKYMAYGIVIILLVGAGIKFYKYINKPPVVTVVMPQDTTGIPITHETYRPKSIPIIEKDKKSKTQLPSNLREKDVDKIITVVKSPADTTYIVFPKDGDPYVNKQGGKVLSVIITEYLPPILAWDWYFKIGVSGNTGQLSPMVGVSFLRIYGKLDLPVFGLDLYGIGLGLDYQIIEPISLGLTFHNSWGAQKTIRLFLVYNL